MSTTHYIQTVIEVLLIVAIIVAMVNEPVLVAWEEKQGKKMLKHLRK